MHGATMITLMSVCTHIYIDAYKQTYTYIHAHIHTHTYIYTALTGPVADRPRGDAVLWCDDAHDRFGASEQRPCGGGQQAQRRPGSGPRDKEGEVGIGPLPRCVAGACTLCVGCLLCRHVYCRTWKWSGGVRSSVGSSSAVLCIAVAVVRGYCSVHAHARCLVDR